MPAPVEEGFALKESVESLKGMILGKHPSMPTLLREIHTALSKQPEQALLLSEEEIHVIVSGLEVQTNTYLAASITPKNKSLAGKIKAGADVSDLLGL